MKSDITYVSSYKNVDLGEIKKIYYLLVTENFRGFTVILINFRMF